MRFNNNMKRLLCASTACALMSVSGVGGFSVYAQDSTQDTNIDEIEEVVVTGSILKRKELITASPVTVVSAEQLDLRGLNTISDAIQLLAANNAGTINGNWNSFNFASGATAVSLRGLTVGSTLTLFDGLRSAVYPLADDGQRSFVDLSTLPNAIVERIEVLKDGGSSTYGSDAVAGVVNVIVKKEITGFHVNSSYGISQEGDADEYHFDFTAGVGELEEQGYNIYVAGEYQKNNPIWSRDRDFPYNSDDLSSICNNSGGCLANGVVNGLQADGSLGGIGNTRVPVVRAYDPITRTPVAGSTFQLLNPTAGCGDLTSLTLTSTQQTALNAEAQQCQQDLRNEYRLASPEVSRYGASARLTVNVGDRAQAYAMVNYAEVHTSSSTTPNSFNGRTASGGTRANFNPAFLPVFVCPTGTPACDVTNGTLNPNNPFAADGNIARLNYRYDRGRANTTSGKTIRISAGIDGSFGDDWVYNIEGTTSRINLDRANINYLHLGNLIKVINDGSYDLVNPNNNTEEQREFIAPTNRTRAYSTSTQFQGTLAHPLFDLAGGEVAAAVGVAYREESVNNPSANAPNEIDPFDRYISVNAVSVVGSRNVKSAFFEIDAPIAEMLNVNVSGRYDDYSTGQSNFSPKVSAIFTPISELKIRGSFSKGFRVPSFSESFGQPTTGFVTTTVDATTAEGAAFIAAHGGNTYATQSYNYGLTSSGNPDLDPEKSTSFTVGFVLEPNRNFSFTADYWHIKVKDLVSSVDTSPVVDLYYQNNGVVNLPGINVVQGVADPDFPNALPLIGSIEFSFRNSDSKIVSGLDFGAHFQAMITDDIHFSSNIDATYLIQSDQTIDGVTQEFAGTLSPCNVTSCSGSPKLRGTWVNSVEWEKFTVALTANYTSGYDNASTDFGGVKGDCLNNLGASVIAYDDGTPFNCTAGSYLDFDMSVNYQVSDDLRVYLNVLDVFGRKAPFDPSAAYGLFNYNPSWASSGFRGRFFRFGVKADF